MKNTYRWKYQCYGVKFQYHLVHKNHARFLTHSIFLTLKEGKFNTTHKYERKDFIQYQTNNLMSFVGSINRPSVNTLVIRRVLNLPSLAHG